jgi:5-methylcytosine-specific restriction protein A
MCIVADPGSTPGASTMISGGNDMAGDNAIPDNFYKTGIWVRKRAEILERDNHECQRCKDAGGYSKGNVVHHIKHLENRPDLALDDDNLLSVCAACHNREHPERFIHRIVQRKRNELAERFPERW